MDTGGCTCDDGLIEKDGQCVAPDPDPQKCESGQTQIIRLPTGWATVNSTGDGLIDKKPISPIIHQCSSGCSYDFSDTGDLDLTDPYVYWDDSPPGSSVLYSYDFQFTSNGDSCNGNDPIPSDPGAGDGGDTGADTGSGSGTGTGSTDPGAGGNSGTPPESPASEPTGTGTEGGGTGGGGGGGGTGAGNGGTPGTGDGTGTGSGNGGTPGNGTGNGNGSGDGSGTGNGTGNGSGDGGTPGTGDDCTKTNTCPDASPGPGLPGIPKLYDPKYPDGIQGVWSEQINSLYSTPVFTLVKGFLPTNIDGGQLPCWNLDLDFGGLLNFGSHDLCVDPSIWPVLRAIVLVSALLLAYKLVFGGA